MPLIGQRAEAYRRPFRIISFTFPRRASMSGSAKALSSRCHTSGCVYPFLLGPVQLEFLEPSFIYGDFLDHFGLRAQAELFELVGKLLAVNEVNRRRTVSGGFLDGIS
jgi:hypothetical protein